MSDNEINLKIARMMPGWTDVSKDCDFPDGFPYPFFYVEPDGSVCACASPSEVDERYWIPATDLNQAAEAVRAIVTSGQIVQFVAGALSDTGDAGSFNWAFRLITAGPRAWCEALVAIGGDREAT